MIDALRYEWVRLRTLRSTYWLIGLTIVIAAGIAVIVAATSRNEPITVNLTANLLYGAGEIPAFTPILMAIIGILAVGHEYRYGTIQPTLTAIPQRSRLLIAKCVVVVATAIAVALVSLLVNLMIGLIFWGEIPSLTDPPLNEAIPGWFVYIALWTLAGIALALLFRGVPSAIVVLLVMPLVVEGIIMGLSSLEQLDWLVPAVKFLPFTAADRLIAVGEFQGWPGAPDWGFFDRWASGGVFAGFIAIVMAVAWYRFQTKDA